MHPKYVQKSTKKSKQKKYPKGKEKETILHGKTELTHGTVVKKQRFRGSRKGSTNHRKNKNKSIKNQTQNHQQITSRKRCCKNFAAIFVPRSPTTTPFVKNIIFRKNNRPKTNMFSKSRPHIPPQPNPQRRKRPQKDSLVMKIHQQNIVFVVVYNRSGHSSVKVLGAKYG